MRSDKARISRGAAGIRKNVNHLQARFRADTGCTIARQQRECQYLERIAGEYCGGLVEGAMRRGLAAA